MLPGTCLSKEVTEPLHDMFPPPSSLSTAPFEPHAVRENLKPDHIEVESMEPSASEEMDGGETSSPLPDMMGHMNTGLPTENLTSGQAFIEDPIQAFTEDPSTTKPSNC